MSKNLVIVESPAKAKTIEGYLGKDFKVVSSFGHVRDLPKDDMAIDVKNGFKPTYEISKDKKKSAPDEAYFLAHVAEIDKKRKKASIPLLMSMAGALLGIGKRTKKLNQEALKVARAIGPITHSESCDPFDVTKHLTSDHAKRKLGL